MAVVPVEHSLFFVLCPIPSYQTRLTSDQPAKGCEVGPGTKNESISVYRSCRPAAAQLFERNAVMVGVDSTRMPGRRSSTVGIRRVRFGSRARTINRRCTILAATYVDLDLTDSSNFSHTQRRTTWGSTKQKVSALRNFLGLAVKERARHSFLHSFIFIAESTKSKRGTSLIVVIIGHL